jgi:hypothetical protein
MTALAANVDTPALAGNDPVDKFTAINADIIYAGGIQAIDYTGEIQPASDTLGLRVIGRAPLKVDNTSDGQKSAAERGIFRFANDTTSPVTRSMIGQPCYVVDDQTVGGNSTYRVAAGLVHDVDANGVWVNMTPIALKLAVDRTPPLAPIAKTDDFTVTAAQAFSRICYLTMDKGSLATFTLPSAVGGMKVGVQRLSATAAHDVAVQAATGDKVLGSAASKKVDNTVDGVSGILWLEAVDATDWVAAWPTADLASWVINNT